MTDLLADQQALLTAHKASVAEETRKAKEAKSRQETAAKAAQEAADRKRLAELAARYQDALPA